MKTIPLKRLVEPTRPITYGIVQAGPHIPGGIPYIRPIDMSGHSGVEVASLQATSKSIAAAYGRSALLPGDLVVSIGPSFGKTMVVPEELRGANLTQGTARVALRPEVQSSFVRWVLQSRNALNYWEASVGGATFRALNLGPLSETPIPVVPIDEQRAIADYLGRETAQIDALVARQEELVALLRERRSSTVTHEVTQSTADRYPLRRVVDVIDCAHVTAEFVGTTMYPVASIRECQGATVDLDDCKYTTEEFYKHLRAAGRAPRVGDLLFVRNVSVGLVSEVAPGTRDFAVGQETVLLRRKANVCPAFLRYALTSQEVKFAIEGAMIGATFRRINVSAIRSLPVPLPALEEQNRIVALLQRQTSHIDALIAKAEEHIALAKERRSALITAAVTGQIDVRTARKAS